MSVTSSFARRGTAVLLAIAAIACRDTANVEPTGLAPPSAAHATKTVAAPSPIVDVAIPGTTLHLYPFVGSTFGTKPLEADPINVIFTGSVDPRGLRAALLALDGDRTAFGMPAAFPFDCTWSDATGEVQGAYVEPAGWIGSAIQLQCGVYAMRFHLRLFDAGGVTIGGAHMDLLVPGTHDHKVISWMLARQIVTVDFMRSGLLSAAPTLTAPFTPTPSFRTIIGQLYNGLPVALRAAIGGPLGDVSADVPLPSDGQAVVLAVSSTPDPERLVSHQKFTIQYGQAIPKPICESGPGDFIYVSGPLEFDQRIIVTPSGNYISSFHALGHLDVTPVSPPPDPTPIGETYRALVNEHHTGIATDRMTLASSLSMQVLLPPSAPWHGRLQVTFSIGPDGVTAYSTEIRCSE